MRRFCLVILLFAFSAGRVYGQEETPASTGSPFNQSKFVPDISLILDCSYVLRNLTDERMRNVLIPQLTHSRSEDEGEGHAHDVMNADRGFNLNYAEITFFSVVDPYFELFAVCHVAENSFGLEEAYWTTKRFPLGLQLKAGKFLSGFGRLNEQHAHYWDFADQPLIHASLFGESGLNEIGARLTWIPPLETYLLIGGEVLVGKNEMSFGSRGFRDPNGAVDVSDADTPNLGLVYVKSSVDIEDLTLLGGVSGAWGNTRIDHGLSVGASDAHALSAETGVIGCELTAKYPLDAIRCLSLQAEYLHRTMKGSHYSYTGGGGIRIAAMESQHSGSYAQIVAKLSQRVRTGIRCDAIHLNDVSHSGDALNTPGGLWRWSGMLEYNPTEFSRIRVQYNYDRSKHSPEIAGFVRETIHELFIQVNLAIGAHGAHSF